MHTDMTAISKLCFVWLASLMLFACDQAEKDSTSTPDPRADITATEHSNKKDNNKVQPDTIAEKLPKSAFETIEWTALIPQEDLDALTNPPSYVTEIEDASMEDQISSQVKNAIESAGDDRYQQALVSTQVVSSMEGKAIRIPGFVVPLEFNDDKTITQFFLVPYFGACIHVPPPPPNQIIFVRHSRGIKLKGLYEPIWVSGRLQTSLTENRLGTAAYTLQMQYMEKYYEN